MSQEKQAATPSAETAGAALKLQRPFTTAAGQRIESLSFRRLKVKDLRAAHKKTSDMAEQEFLLIAQATGLVPEDLDEMDAADFRNVQERFRELLGVAGQ